MAMTQKQQGNRRFVLFNVNGLGTLFQYYPWNTLRNSYDEVFRYLDADVVSLQELKMGINAISAVADLRDYRSFITIPKTRKGYSGVGLFVKNEIPVLKAEEGITGWLRCQNVAYRDLGAALIGGYPLEEELSSDRALKLDSEGRCVIAELPNDLVVASVYCPANSMATDEGEEFRLEFLHVLLTRLRKLHDMGKKIILLGDINVALDLIDSAEAIDERIKNNLISPNGVYTPQFELLNPEACAEFKLSRPARKLLNTHVHYSLDSPTLPTQPSQFLYDTTRIKQGRRRAMYTVWNTLTSARLSNYGSRIDLILASSKEMCDNATEADIWPSIKGSDHCPIFTDFAIDFPQVEQPKLPFEARLMYKVARNRDILLMFAPKKAKSSTENNNHKRSLDFDLVEVKRAKLEQLDRSNETGPRIETDLKIQTAVTEANTKPEKSIDTESTENTMQLGKKDILSQKPAKQESKTVYVSRKIPKQTHRGIGSFFQVAQPKKSSKDPR